MSTSNPKIAADLRRVAKHLGLRTGFPTCADRAALPYVVAYPSLSRERMSDRRFERGYSAAIHAAVRIAGRLGYLVEPISDHRRVVVGREFRFSSSLAAIRFRLAVDAAFAGRHPLFPEVGG